jgi:hypothetical protein
MASPLNLIEQGIRKGDWSKVVLGFFNLSGKKLKAPAGKGVRVRSIDDVPEEIQQEIAERYTSAIKAAVLELSTVVELDDLEPPQEVEEEPEDEPEEEEEEEEIPESDPTISEEAVEEEQTPFEESDDGRAPAPAAGTVEAAASQARAIARGEKTLPDFTHVHTGQTEQNVNPELGRLCRKEAVKPGPLKNKFKDNLTAFRELIPIDKALVKGRKPSKRRPPVRKVKVKCFKCEKDFMEYPALIPKAIKVDDGVHSTSYVCDSCTRRGNS